MLEQLLTRWPNLSSSSPVIPLSKICGVTFKLKVFDYLAKPFSFNQLRQTLRNAVETFGLGRTDQVVACAQRLDTDQASCVERDGLLEGPREP